MKKKLEKEIIENVSIEPLDDVMSDRYGIYAKYVILDRAIPDARDGLKPVQRRIIYSMWMNKNTSVNKTRKCAKIVGDVIGKYHPHGDTSVYDALVRMSQDFKVRMPLITFQGNNGSIDGDAAAAYRYTEAKLSELADELVRDLNKNATEMTLTYDDTEYEPIVLPSFFPNLFTNGAEGIAVAIATEIPPHNLKELIDAIIYRIQHNNATILDLLNYVKGPDFPTGGVIVNSEGLKNIYETGRGRIEIVSKSEIIKENGINQIVISEIPYKAIKINIVHEIDEIRHQKIIEGIQEVRDESGRNGLRIVIDCKKGSNPDAILKYLLQKTSLSTSYTANIVAIVNGHPKTLNLMDYVDCYIAHQVNVIANISNFDLEKNKIRLQIVNGLIKAIASLDEVIKIIRHSENKADAKSKLEAKFNFNANQSEAIVMMPLYKLSHTDINILNEEKIHLDEQILHLNEILNDRKILNKVIVNNLKGIAKKYSNPRRTTILENGSIDKQFDKRDLISKEDVMVSLTHDGYIKRSSIKSYKSSDESLPGVKINDSLIFMKEVNTEDYIIAFTSKGNYALIPVHEIPETKWKDEGKQLNYKINYNAQEEKFIKAFSIKKFNDGIFFVLVSKNGQIKRSFIKDFYIDRCNRLFLAIRLLSSDELVDVAISTGNDNLLLFTSDGYASFYNESCLIPLSLKAGGIKSVSKVGKSLIAGLLTFNKEEKSKILLITDHGHYRIFDNAHIDLTKRLMKMTLIMPTFKSDPHKIRYISKLDSKEEVNIYANSLLKGLMCLNIKDFYLTPLDKYAKTNLNIIRRDRFTSFYNYGEVINPNLISTYVKNNSANENEEKSEENILNKHEEVKHFTQISIFDEGDDE